MWCDHAFSQRNRTTERTVWVGVAGNREVEGGGIGQNLKKGGGGIGNISIAPLC